MWIFTPIGFFSVVKKEHDAEDEITIRARVRANLEAKVLLHKILYEAFCGPFCPAEFCVLRIPLYKKISIGLSLLSLQKK